VGRQRIARWRAPASPRSTFGVVADAPVFRCPALREAIATAARLPALAGCDKGFGHGPGRPTVPHSLPMMSPCPEKIKSKSA